MQDIGLAGLGDYGEIQPRRDGKLCAGGSCGIELVYGAYGAGPDAHVFAEAVAQHLDQLQGAGRVECHLHDENGGGQECVADFEDFLGGKVAAHDSDDAVVLHSVRHLIRSQFHARAPLAKGRQFCRVS